MPVPAIIANHINVSRLRVHLRHFDWVLLCVTSALIIVGMLFVYSAGSRRFALKQGMHLLLGAVAFAIVLWRHYSTFVRWSYAFYGSVVALLAGVLVFGRAISGSKRWLEIGSYRFQPSEFMKLAFILALSKCIVDYRDGHKRWSGLWRPIGLALLPMALIIKEPDLGMTCIFVPILLAVLYAAGTPKRHLAIMIGVMLAGALCAWPMLKPYQRNRLMAFIKPKADPSGSGYHIIQSLIAVGSGGFTGSGWRQGMQNLLGRLPERHTDFIFPVIAEEWGFIGASFTLLLYYMLLHTGFSIAMRTRDPAGRYVVVGIVALFATQILVNIGMTIGLAPVTGITLPFASYGGSSLLCSLIAMAIVANVAMRRERVLTVEGFR